MGHNFYRFGLKLGMVLLFSLKLDMFFFLKKTTRASHFIFRRKIGTDKSFDAIKRGLPGVKMGVVLTYLV